MPAPTTKAAGAQTGELTQGYGLFSKEGGAPGAAAFAAAVAVLIAAQVLPGALVPAAALLILAGAGIVAGLMAKGQAVTPVLLVRRDQEGAAYVDREQWWKHDESEFPDAWRWPCRGGRILFLDNLDGETVLPLNPWLAPMPAGAGAPAPADVSQAQLEAKALETTMKIRAGMQEAFKVAILAAFGLGGLIAVYMAGQQALEMLR